MTATILLFAFFCILSFFSPAQDYSYTNYSSKEGLAGSTVYCIQQDKEGFIWFGTETGLSRFDGARFKNFTTTDGLPDNEILRLYVDSKNRVWIIPFKNSICYYWKGRIYNSDNDTLLRSIGVDSRIRSVQEDRYGNILLAAEYDLTIIRPDGKVRKIKEIDGVKFVTGEAGLTEKGTFKLVLAIGGKDTFCELDNETLKLLKRDGRLWAAMYGLSGSYMLFPEWEVIRKPDSILFFHLKRNEITALRVPEHFNSMYKLNDSLFVINAEFKSNIYNANQKKVVEKYLDGHNITAIFEDAEKSLWFATLAKGVFRLRSREFRNISFIDNNSSLPVFSIQKSNNLIYVGTSNCLVWAFDPRNQSLSKQRLRPAQNNTRVLSIAKGNQNKLLIATDAGVFEVGKSIRMTLFPRAIKTVLFYNDTLLAATATSVSRGVIGTNGEWRQDSLWYNRSTCAIPHNDGFYAGTLNGLYQINGRKEVVSLGERNPRLKHRISAIAKGANNMIWIATYGEGVIGMQNDNIVKHITQDQGLSSNMCRNIFISGDDLWIGTDKGLNKVVIRENRFTITKFTVADGLRSDIINAVYVDGTMVYVGTSEGITYFDERKISQSFGCILRITAINISDKTWDFDTTVFSLPHRDNNIQIEFAGLSYKSAGDITYQYRLIGLDSTWKATREQSLSYPSLPSGDYELQLVAVNKFGIKSEAKTVAFTIEKLLTEKTWFRLSLLLGAAGCCWFIISLYTRRIRRKEAEKVNTLRKMSELEQMALKAQMNPHFIFNSLNSIQQYVMHKDTAGANKFITDFSSLIRQTLDFSSRQEINLAEDLQYLSTYLELEKTRMENKFEYNICVEDGIVLNDYRIPPMILQPYVENSIRHGIGYRKDKHGKIVIKIFRQSDQLVCSIDDNGVGRQFANQFKQSRSFNQESKGMSLTATRIEMFNKNSRHKIELSIHDKKDKEGNASGTCVMINFPDLPREPLHTDKYDYISNN
jgi:ligand-binding sensor domain-containing protein/two-component sensor histidine kinase